ncbi:YycH family regulatory protein [Ureibacillus sinduriensis]|uniref:YycH family regulatory protein n=1 Tax=Ureibacillus sinduriensis TaxID=561440 RepID=UPI000AFCBA5E|nr:two-component system activity regulator YycH [Ureibacillus sinduriensis]
MKHVEQIKSFVLFLLVILSLILTFSIWTYTPNYENIEDSAVKQIKLGDEKEIQEVLKPYRILSYENGNFSGTVSTSAVRNVMEAIAGLNATELMYMQSNLSEEEINSKIHSENQMTLFFPAEIPIDTFRSVLKFTQSDLHKITFSHILIDWSNLKQNQGRTLELSFISKEKQTLATTVVAISEEQFHSTFIKATQKFVPYEEIERPNELSIYVPSNPVDLVQYTYYIDEISSEKFKNVLFKDTNLVRKNIESNTYTDGMAMMTSDSRTKTISYVYAPPSERIVEIEQSELIQDSYDFINQHGGLTGDYRYSYSNVGNRIIEYQLFLQGLPVFSSNTSTRITVTWGDNQVFKYTRPYYLFGVSESSTHQLPSGPEVIETLETLKNIDDLVLGYNLTPDPQKPKVYSLEPRWFVIRDGSSIPLTNISVGGVQYGLE